MFLLFEESRAVGCPLWDSTAQGFQLRSTVGLSDGCPHAGG